MNKFNFSKSWTKKDDFPTYEESEEQVRQDMQLLHDETRDAVNALIDTLSGGAGAAEIGALAPKGLNGASVQALIDELADAISGLAGDVSIDGSTLTELVAAALESNVLGGYYSSEQVDAIISALGISTLSSRLTTIENTLSADGVAVGEVVCEYPFTAPCAELAGFESNIYADKSKIFINGRLIGFNILSNETYLKSLDVLSGELKSIKLSGQSFSSSNISTSSYSIRWIDNSGEYLIIQFSSAYYFVSLVSGMCSKLCSGSDYSYGGCLRFGDIVCSMFCRSSTVYIYRRDVSADSAATPVITNLDDYYEAGSAYDRIIGSCGDTMYILKYSASDSHIKAIKPANMSSAVEYSTGLGGVYAYGSIRPMGDACYFLMYRSGKYRIAKCAVSDGGVPSIIVNGEEELGYNAAIIARGEGVIYCVHERTLRVLNADTLELESSITLPYEIPGSLTAPNGYELKPLCCGKYLILYDRLIDLETMKSRYIRCNGKSPVDYAIQPEGARRVLCYADSRWYMLDCMLRPVWGMVPYFAGGGD